MHQLFVEIIETKPTGITSINIAPFILNNRSVFQKVCYITIHIQFFTKCVNTNENKFSVKLILSFPETSLLQIMLSLFCANKRNSTEIILSFKTSPKHFRRKCLLLRFSVYYTNLKVVMDNLHFMRNRCAINIDLSRFAFKFL